MPLLIVDCHSGAAYQAQTITVALVVLDPHDQLLLDQATSEGMPEPREGQ